MAARRNGRNGTGDFVTWLQLNIAELKATTKELQAMSARHEVHLARLDHTIVLLTREVAENRRQTREVAAELARVDARAQRHETALARELAKLGTRVTRVERRGRK